jgi:hypothetical protein
VRLLADPGHLPDRNSPEVCTPTSLKGTDPARYAPLVAAPNSYDYDIFSQGAQAVRHPKGIAPLGGLKAQKLIAYGASQSAWTLDGYIESGADAATRIFDGFIINADVHAYRPATYRVPALQLLTEDSASPMPAMSGPNFVVWDVAGAPHTAPPNTGDYGQEGPSAHATCAGGSEFPGQYILDSAISGMGEWVQTGRPMPSAPPFEFTPVAPVADALPTADFAINGLPQYSVFRASNDISPVNLSRDADGNAIGGLRLPVITVPVAGYNGNQCNFAAGTTTALTPVALTSRYPTHDDYVTKMLTATKAAVQSRYMTAADGLDQLQRACASAIPSWGTTPASKQPAVCRTSSLASFGPS